MDENLASFIHPILLLQTRKKKGEIFYGNENLFLGLPILTYGVCSPCFLSVQFMTSSCFILRSARPTPPVWASTSVYDIHPNVLNNCFPQLRTHEKLDSIRGEISERLFKCYHLRHSCGQPIIYTNLLETAV
jgi:hypothetical protein